MIKSTPEIELLILCARQKFTNAQEIRAFELCNDNIDWNLFIELTYTHEITPIIYQNLKRYLESAVPHEIFKQTHNFYFLNAQSNLGLLNQLFNIIDFLESHKIACLPFKGIINAELIYHNLAARKSGDIDILVQKKDFKKAKKLFLESDFILTLSEKIEHDCLQSGLFNEQRGLSIDLHYGIQPKILNIKSEKLFDHPSNIAIAGRTLKTFSLFDTIIILCVNAAKDYWNQRLYTYCDIYELLIQQPSINWGAIINRAEELGCKRIMYSALLVLYEIYAQPESQYISTEIHSYRHLQLIKKELLAQLFPENIDGFSSIKGKPYYLASDKYFHLQRMDKMINRVNYRLPKSLAFNEKDLSFVHIPERFAFLYYIMRPIRIVKDFIDSLYRRIKGEN